MNQQIVKQLVPNKFKKVIRKSCILLKAVECYFWDIYRYLKFSTTLKKPKTFEQFEARIIAHYHVIEKGLSLRNVRVGFGKGVIKSLLKLLENYVKLGYPVKKESFKAAIGVLKGYLSFNKINKQDIDDIETVFLNILKSVNIKNGKLGGVIELTKNEILRNAKKDFRSFVMSRYSIRNFSDKEIDINILIDAVKIAQKSPSVCNRQATKVYIVVTPYLIEKVLSLQNGSRGFGHLTNKLIVVTSDLQYFEGIRERNQPFIDAGIFSMSLLYALHYEGLGACPLNWCAKPDKDRKLRNLLKIKECETIMLIIAVGHLPDKLNITKSARKNINDIVKIR
jgi:nitroreductase